MPKQRVEPDAVFLNIPYDPQFERLYLAYIVGLTILGFVPRATLGIPSGTGQFGTDFRSYPALPLLHPRSVSRATGPQGTKHAQVQFPFELGIAVAWAAQSPLPSHPVHVRRRSIPAAQIDQRPQRHGFPYSRWYRGRPDAGTVQRVPHQETP